MLGICYFVCVLVHLIDPSDLITPMLASPGHTIVSMTMLNMSASVIVLMKSSGVMQPLNTTPLRLTDATTVWRSVMFILRFINVLTVASRKPLWQMHVVILWPRNLSIPTAVTLWTCLSRPTPARPQSMMNVSRLVEVTTV